MVGEVCICGLAFCRVGLRAITFWKMKIRLFVVLAAFGVALAGNVHANPYISAPQSIESQSIDPALLDQIVELVAAQSDMPCCEVRAAYDRGELEITKTDDGYEARLVETESGPVIIAIRDDL